MSKWVDGGMSRWGNYCSRFTVHGKEKWIVDRNMFEVQGSRFQV